MTNELQIFNSEEFGQVRCLEINDGPWFVGKDIADILGYQNGSRDINRHVDEEDKMLEMIPQYQNGTLVSKTLLINESGLYSLILSSKLPTAKKFKRWVTSEILPQIRKTGSYQKPMCMEDILIAQLQEMKSMRLEVAEAKQGITESKQEIQNMRDTITIKPDGSWRKTVVSVIKNIGMKNNNYQEVTNEAYKSLDERAGTNIKQRLENLKTRAKSEGMCKSKVDRLNYLDVIEQDKKLIEIYIGIVKELAIKYNVEMKEV